MEITFVFILVQTLETFETILEVTMQDCIHACKHIHIANTTCFSKCEHKQNAVIFSSFFFLKPAQRHVYHLVVTTSFNSTIPIRNVRSLLQF